MTKAEPATNGLFVRRGGVPDGPPVLFLHGVGNTAGMWDGHVAAMQEYHCLAPDLPGHGRSNRVPWTSRADTTDAVADVLRAFANGRRAHVVGLSLGGSVAFGLLERHPDLVDHVIIDGCAALPTPMSPVMKAGVRLVAPLIRRPAVARLIARSVGVTEPSAVADLVVQLAAADPTSFRRAFADAQDVRITPALLRATAPTLFVAGEKELAAVRRSNRELARSLPRGEVRFMPGAPHGWLGGAHHTHVSMVRAWLRDEPLPAILAPDPPAA
jgi:pimeloyl-ACP methyl ester carboxylesterase